MIVLHVPCHHTDHDCELKVKVSLMAPGGDIKAGRKTELFTHAKAVIWFCQASPA